MNRLIDANELCKEVIERIDFLKEKINDNENYLMELCVERENFITENPVDLFAILHVYKLLQQDRSHCVMDPREVNLLKERGIVLAKLPDGIEKEGYQHTIQFYELSQIYKYGHKMCYEDRDKFIKNLSKMVMEF